jgi:hypothetical protein
MGPLVVQEHEIMHCIVERLPTRSRSFLPCGSRPPSSAKYGDFQDSRVRDFVPILV